MTVTVDITQQTWKKQSLPQRYVCVGCQLNSDKALRLLCLNGHVEQKCWEGHEPALIANYSERDKTNRRVGGSWIQITNVGSITSTAADLYCHEN